MRATAGMTPGRVAGSDKRVLLRANRTDMISLMKTNVDLWLVVAPMYTVGAVVR